MRATRTAISPRLAIRTGSAHACQSTGPATSVWQPSGRPSSSCARRARRRAAGKVDAGRDAHLVRASRRGPRVAMLPVAPAGTGQPPSSPKLDSNDAAARPRARRARWPGPGRACCGSGRSARPRAERRARRGEEARDLRGVGHARSCRRSRSPARRRRPGAARSDQHALARDAALVGAAEADADDALAAQPARRRARPSTRSSPVSDSSTERLTFCAVVRLATR